VTLPKGWAEASIADLAAVNPKHDPNTDRDQTVSFVPMPAVDEHLGAIVGQVDRLLHDVWTGFTHFAEGDVIFAKITPCMENGKAAVARGLTNGRACGSTEFYVLRPEQGVEADYLWRLLRQRSFRAEAEQHMSGAVGQRRVPRAYLENFGIALPPSAEQRRIVAKLDALTAHLARARAELDRVPVLAANLRSTALAQVYRETVGQGGSLPVEHFVATLDQGWSPKCESFPASDDAWGVLKTTAVQALDFWPRENKALPIGLAPRPGIEVKQGDILVTRAGPRVRCGITCHVRETRSKLMLADKMYRLRCKPHLAVPAYIALMLNAPESLALIESMKTGISDSGLNLTQEKFLSIPIPDLSVERQEAVVSHLEVAFARAERFEAEAARARALIDRLEAAILTKAFRGELVPQDPNDEPASVLLDRIRAQRAAAPKTKRGRRAKAEA
jgi:type I restriction enzyme, S subunit